MTSTTALQDCLTGLYDESWQGFIVPDAFAHPAKFARGLVFWLIDHALSEGWLVPGDTCADPFAGIGTGALPCLLKGVHWLGCELEPKFVALGQQNLAYWQQRYAHRMQGAQARLVQGDSRQLCAVLGKGVGCVMSSPPYADAPVSALDAGQEDAYRRTGKSPRARQAMVNEQYGTTPGNLGNLPPGSVEAVVSSPPYAGTAIAHCEGNVGGYPGGRKASALTDVNGNIKTVDYGQTPGQLGAMASGEVAAVLSSPPYEASQYEDGRRRNPEHKGLVNHRMAVRSNPRRPGEKLHLMDYAPQTTEGNIAKDSGETFWSAARAILEQTFALLRPGGHALFVTKMYVRNGALVPFPDQWRQLCEHVGFVTLHEHHALLSTQHGVEQDLFGGETVRETRRISFFRRNNEKKGAPRIDYETVHCLVKPGQEAR